MGDDRSNIYSLPAGDTSQKAMTKALSAAAEKINQNEKGYPDFFPAAQRDFAARLKWSVSPKYADANHSPDIEIEGPMDVLASPGETIKLNAAVSDPDNDKVTVNWWQFMVGTFPGKVSFANANTTQVKLTIPNDAVSGQTIHVIIEATDNGSPSLTAYRRIIITIK